VRALTDRRTSHEVEFGFDVDRQRTRVTVAVIEVRNPFHGIKEATLVVVLLPGALATLELSPALDLVRLRLKQVLPDKLRLPVF
jgi:hypothetical protein